MRALANARHKDIRIPKPMSERSGISGVSSLQNERLSFLANHPVDEKQASDEIENWMPQKNIHLRKRHKPHQFDQSVG
jgi:hypothetical protein